MLSSCEKTVNINLNAGAPQLVVDAQIETGLPPIVVLTTTVGFFSNIDLSTIQNTFVHNAVVTVSDGSKTFTLKEYSFDTSLSSKYYIYSDDTTGGLNPNNILVGQVNHIYKRN